LRAAAIDVVEVLAGEIRLDDLPRGVVGSEVDTHSVPLRPRCFFERERDRLRVKLALCVEVVVEAAARQPGVGHDVVDRYALETVAVEERFGPSNDVSFGLLAVLGAVRHGASSAELGSSVPQSPYTWLPASTHGMGSLPFVAVYSSVMLRKSELPTIPPSFDVRKFAQDSDARVVTAEPVPVDDEVTTDPELLHSEMRLATRPTMGAMGDEAWARLVSISGAPVVVQSAEQIKRLPLDHRAGFVLSLMDGTIDLETLIDLSMMAPEEVLRLVRDLFESGVIEFR
jgi:hypothetical protein